LVAVLNAPGGLVIQSFAEESQCSSTPCAYLSSDDVRPHAGEDLSADVFDHRPVQADEGPRDHDGFKVTWRGVTLRGDELGQVVCVSI
jgi:hypothetical protein